MVRFETFMHYYCTLKPIPTALSFKSDLGSAIGLGLGLRFRLSLRVHVAVRLGSRVGIGLNLL